GWLHLHWSWQTLLQLQSACPDSERAISDIQPEPHLSIASRWDGLVPPIGAPLRPIGLLVSLPQHPPVAISSTLAKLRVGLRELSLFFQFRLRLRTLSTAWRLSTFRSQLQPLSLLPALDTVHRD